MFSFSVWIPHLSLKGTEAQPQILLLNQCILSGAKHSASRCLLLFLCVCFTAVCKKLELSSEHMLHCYVLLHVDIFFFFFTMQDIWSIVFERAISPCTNSIGIIFTFILFFLKLFLHQLKQKPRAPRVAGFKKLTLFKRSAWRIQNCFLPPSLPCRGSSVSCVTLRSGGTSVQKINILQTQWLCDTPRMWCHMLKAAVAVSACQ